MGEPSNTAIHAPSIFVSGRISYAGRQLAQLEGVKLQAGAWTAILGRSGCGKTSLLRALAGLLSAPEFTGKIETSDDQPLEGRIAWMGQADQLAPWASAKRNAAMGALLRGEPIDDAKVAQALAAVGLAHRADAAPGALSGGERQRVALARTLLEDRPVALLDEPFSALDAATRADLQELAWERLRGKTVVLVTHDPLEAARMASKVYLFQSGAARLIKLADPPPPRAAHAPEAIAIAARLTTELRSAV